jgi:hypothetical protein
VEERPEERRRAEAAGPEGDFASALPFPLRVRRIRARLESMSLHGVRARVAVPPSGPRASRLPRLSGETLAPYGLVGSAALPCGLPHRPELLNPVC